MRRSAITHETWFAVAMAILVSTLLVLAVWPVIRRIFNYGANLYLEKEANKKAAKARAAGAAPMRPRQTDLMGRMTAQDRATYRNAEELLAQHRVVEAAGLFEAIKFQRRAIDELEKAKLIDEACQVLLRMNVPARAAAIYERNNILDKAALHYGEAGQHEAAGKVFVKLARQDINNLLKAGDAFERGHKPVEAMQAFASVLQTGRVLALAQKSSAHSQLADYLADHVTASEALPTMTPSHLNAFFAELELTPRHIRLLAQWLQIPASHPFTKTVLERTARQTEIIGHYWAAVPPSERTAAFARLATLELAPDIYTQHKIAFDKQERGMALHVAARNAS